MAARSFTMYRTKARVFRYVLIIFVPTLLAHLLYFIPPLRSIWNDIAMYIPIAVMGALTYYFILSRLHTLKIKNHEITKISITGKEKLKIKAKQIRSVKRNFLDEILLMDKDGRIILRVEPYMKNRTLFEQWLIEHHIN